MELKIPEMRKEGGVTIYSLHNAKLLINKFGKPDRVILNYVVDPWDYVCIAEWGNDSFTFSGFSWGYYGEGSRGLAEFLNLCRPKTDTDTWFKKVTSLEREINDYKII
ncbi:MAG: hypothetical protein WC119_00225 [Synergistaceae bacterium]